LIGICRNAGLLQIDFGGLYSCRASNETKVNIISIHSEYIDALNVEEN
jgi:hypothetical protein